MWLSKQMVRIGILAAGLSAFACGPGSKPGADGDGGNGDGSDAGPGGGDAGACEDVVDVVFVLDVSSSMNFVLDKMQTEIGSVVTAANMLSPDAHFGLIAFADNHALDATGPLEGGKVHVAADTLQAAFENYQSVYTANNRNPGDGPTGPDTQNPICEENSLDALYAAAEDFPWRANATRVVIVVTDDTFLESPDNYGDRDGDHDTTSTDYPTEGNYPAKHTIVETVAALKGAKARVFSFTLLVPPALPSLVQCGTPRRFDWADISDGWSSDYQGAMPIPTQTDGANFDLKQVKDNKLSLSETINNVVVDSFCNPPVD